MVGKWYILHLIIPFLKSKWFPDIVSLNLRRRIHKIPELLDMDKWFCEILIVLYWIAESDFKECEYRQKPHHITECIRSAKYPHSEKIIGTYDNAGQEKFWCLKQKWSPESLTSGKIPRIIKHSIHLLNFSFDGIVLQNLKFRHNHFCECSRDFDIIFLPLSSIKSRIFIEIHYCSKDAHNHHKPSG